MEKKFMKVVLLTAVLAATTSVYANDNGENLVYFGAGSAQSGNPLKSSNTPMSLGYLKISNTSDSVWGFDIGGEGTMLDSTWNQNKSVKQATSFNFLAGRNLNKTENSRFDAALLVGGRQTFSSCPS